MLGKDVIISGSIIAINIKLTIAAKSILNDIDFGLVNNATKWYLPKIILWARVRIHAIIDNSALIGNKSFISLLPFFNAPVYITTINNDVAKALFVNSGNI